MEIENAIRAIEILSVGPAYFKGLIAKQIHLYKIASGQGSPYQRTNYLDSTSKIVDGRHLTPAGYYTGVWCRDASFMLHDMLETADKGTVMKWIDWIWQNQIRQGQKIVFGRGSPQNGFRLRAAKEGDLQRFAGALPSSIQYRYNEIYGADIDIDSTALIVSATCQFCIQYGSTSERFISRIREAMATLARKDIDDDGLLEQGSNEDWMDSMLRSGKIVYSQAVWAMALKNWSNLLTKFGESQEAEAALQDCKRTIRQVNSKLWNKSSSCYSDMIIVPDEENKRGPHSDGVGGQADAVENNSSPITQDVSFFLVLEEKGSERARTALDTMKKMLWTDIGSRCISPPRGRTGPLEIKPHNYQNGAFWPWITSFEIRSRLMHGSMADCEELLRKTLPYSFFEWVNPFTKASGSYPFRTSIAATRTVLRQFLNWQKDSA